MESVKGTKTEQNLLKAFAGESQARMRYNLYAKKAREEGYEQIAAIFLETAEQEAMHASRFFSCLDGGKVDIEAAYPAGPVGTTRENLKHAAEGENEEWSHLYPEFANVAEEEGFKKVAQLFRIIAKAEVTHENRYLKLMENIDSDRVFKSEDTVKWYCRKCGYVHESRNAPVTCPACLHQKAFFEKMAENY